MASSHSRVMVLKLTKAAELGDAARVKDLLEAGTDANKTGGNVSPLLIAAWKGNTECVKLLLEAGADVNQASRWGTPLWGAMSTRNDRYLFQLLVKSGADVNASNDRGETPMKEVANAADTFRVKLCLGAGARVNVPLPLHSKLNVATTEIAVLLFAAGEQDFMQRAQPTRFLPPDWGDVNLKNLCRKAIRKHLLTLDPHTNLFIRVPQLQMTNKRAGLPEKLVSYLLYQQSVEVDWSGTVVFQDILSCFRLGTFFPV